MDNMRSHYVKKVAEVLEKAGVELLYLPPYSPDFNPIEKMWSKINAILRKLKIHVYTELLAAIKSAFSRITSEDCHGWFSSTGVFW